MSTRLVWIVPANYDVPEERPLCFDLSEHCRRILRQELSQRPYSYGFVHALRNFDPERITRARIILPEIRWWDGQGTEHDAAKDVVGAYCEEAILACPTMLKEANLGCSKSVAFIECEFTFEAAELGALHAEKGFEYVELYQQCLSIAKEIGAMFRAACHLTFHCEYAIVPSIEAQRGGLVVFSASGQCECVSERASEFAYPVVFLKDALPAFSDLLESLSRVWHLPLWPLFRFLRALDAEYVQMESFLDLLYALEGLFKQNASSQSIKLACAILTGASRAEALEAIHVLSCAYAMRNKIVHDGVFYTGMEHVKVGGKEVLSQQVFWDLKRIVALMLRVALGKLLADKKMAHLRIIFDDVIQRCFPQTPAQ
jgi:hypothetical protein